MPLCMRLPVRLLPLLTALLSGCGTLMNLRSPTTASHLPPSPVPRAAIYGGVQLDAAAGRRSFDSATERPGQALVGAYMWGIDLPVSALADTATLPITVPASIRREINEYYFPETAPRLPAPAGAEIQETSGDKDAVE